MLLRRNKDLYDTITALAGVRDFTADEKNDIVALTNRRLTSAYNKSNIWDRYLVVGEERRIATIKVERAESDAYNGYYIKNGKTLTSNQAAYADADVYVKSNDKSVYFYKTSGNIWQLTATDGSYTLDPITNVVTISGSPTTVYRQDTSDEDNHDKPSGVNFWRGTGLVNTDIQNMVVTDVTTALYDQLEFPIYNSALTIPTISTINDFHRIHQDEPFFKRTATEYDFFTDIDGAQILNYENDLDIGYITYKKHIVNTTTGKVITTMDTEATSSFVTEIPAEFFNYTAHGVYADFLRMDGQTEKAAFEEEKAELFLATELERVDIINNNNSLNRKISTYVNRTLR
jgi:hypothetical protein